MHTLSGLPVELLLEIIQHLPPPSCDIGNLRLTSRLFSRLAHPFLYRLFQCPAGRKLGGKGVAQRRVLHFLRLLKRSPRIGLATTHAIMDWDAVLDSVYRPDPRLRTDYLGGSERGNDEEKEDFSIWDAIAQELGLDEGEDPHPLRYDYYLNNDIWNGIAHWRGDRALARHYLLANMSAILLLSRLPNLRSLKVVTDTDSGPAGREACTFFHPCTKKPLALLPALESFEWVNDMAPPYGNLNFDGLEPCHVSELFPVVCAAPGLRVLKATRFWGGQHVLPPGEELSERDDTNGRVESVRALCEGALVAATALQEIEFVECNISAAWVGWVLSQAGNVTRFKYSHLVRRFWSDAYDVLDYISTLERFKDTLETVEIRVVTHELEEEQDGFYLQNHHYSGRGSFSGWPRLRRLAVGYSMLDGSLEETLPAGIVSLELAVEAEAGARKVLDALDELFGDDEGGRCCLEELVDVTVIVRGRTMERDKRMLRTLRNVCSAAGVALAWRDGGEWGEGFGVVGAM